MVDPDRANGYDDANFKEIVVAFVRMKGLPGLVFVHDKQDNREKKHNCPDCDMCQWCSDERCSQCLLRKRCTGKCGKKKGK